MTNQPQLSLFPATIKQSISLLEPQLATIRSRIVSLTSQSSSSTTIQAESITAAFLECRLNLQQYVDLTQKQLQAIKNQLIQTIPLNKESSIIQNKVSLYIWQIFNFIIIHSQDFPSPLTPLLLPLLTIDTRLQPLQSPNSLKHALIFLHNWIAKKSTQQKDESLQLKMLGQTLTHYFDREGLQEKDKGKESVKSEEYKVSQMQWVGYILMKLFNNDSNTLRKYSLLERVCQLSPKRKVFYYLINILGSYIQNMIDKRVTTQLVTGFQCKIPDVKDMYCQSDKGVSIITLSLLDLKYLLQSYKVHMVQYQEIIIEYLRSMIQDGTQTNQFERIKQKWTHNVDCLTEIAQLLNNLLFLGGYNQPLQEVITYSLLIDDLVLFNHLQLSYLLYRNIQSTRYKSKVLMIEEMGRQASKKLFSFCGLQALSNSEIDIKGLILERILAPGQLVLLMRLLTNLVHINQQALVPFQKDNRYLHIVLSLTHDSASQATMKQWAIMFIRNVSQWSPQLRQEIGKIKMEVKVE